MHPVELARLLQNLIRLGTIAEIDHAAARVRVTCGDLLTDWLPWLESRAGQTRTWNPPTLGEQVLLLAPGGELGGAVVLGAINSNEHPAPSSDPNLTRWLMPDGAVIEYDHAASHLRATIPGSAAVTAGTTVDVEAAGAVTVKTDARLTATAAAGAIINANTIINGNLTLNGNFAQPAGQTATMSGSVKFEGPVTSNGKNISSSHTHDNVEPGSGKSGSVS